MQWSTRAPLLIRLVKFLQHKDVPHAHLLGEGLWNAVPLSHDLRED